MAKVYTMGELERARKKAQIREWVQDKKDKATNWCYAHKNEILTYLLLKCSALAIRSAQVGKSPKSGLATENGKLFRLAQFPTTCCQSS